MLDARKQTVVATPAPQAGDSPATLSLNSVPLGVVLSPDQLAQVEAHEEAEEVQALYNPQKGPVYAPVEIDL